MYSFRKAKVAWGAPVRAAAVPQNPTASLYTKKLLLLEPFSQ
jgi:hypothetical protein